ncbi:MULTISPECIES: O-methyltransferase [Streptomyces]|uniref:O-methyltransferase n=1 Tax=Streptomyces TaxID=1883 RepID=UPI002022459C|nr:class I SAM-dependent methyltransferase [Streptomyces sp. MCA2]MCL7492515.1 class I SAM-dependent methyltransferase [Streptomyces sp. MCA2]
MTTAPTAADRFGDIKAATLTHLEQHGCGCYPYADGSLLATLTAATKATTVVELGTALGYSAAWFATTGAHVHTIDRDPTHSRRAHEHLARHGLADHVTVHTGEGTDILPGVADQDADVAFFDGYPPTTAAVQALAATLRPGGLLIAGNMTLGGQAEQIRGRLASWQHTDLGETLLAVKPQ